MGEKVTIEDKSIGIALSGRGFRAALFGLGSLWRLNEVGLLGKLDRIASVSGGSILSGILAHRWTRLDFDEGRAGNFEEVIAGPVQEFCSKTIDVDAGLLGMITPFKTAGEFLADRFDKDLFHGARLKDIPAAADQGPEFIFNATNMQTGRSFRFLRDMVVDEVLGVSRTAEFTLADAVAASSAFPPIFSPVILKSDPSVWEGSLYDFSSLDDLRRRIILADGGVYDNMGLESLVNRADIFLVCDAGAHCAIEERPFEDDLLQLGRVRDILIDQTRALQKRWLAGDLEAGRKQGAYWGIDTKIAEFKASGVLTEDNAKTARMETISTRLRLCDERDQGRLINWGYALADAALRSDATFIRGPAAAWPLPEWHLN
jgi:NTE family protein